VEGFEKFDGSYLVQAKEELYGLFIILINPKRFTCYSCTRKNEQKDLTPEQIKILKKAIKENLL